VTYLVGGPGNPQAAAVVDPVFDYDHKSGKADVASAETVMAKAAEAGICASTGCWRPMSMQIISRAAPYIKLKTGAKVVIGENIRLVQQIFRPIFNALDVSGSGAEFDVLVKDGDTLKIGNLAARSLQHQGTRQLACLSGSVMRYSWATHCSCRTMARRGLTFRAVMRVRSTAPSASSWHCRKETRLFMCHDYLPKEGPQSFAWETTVGEELDRNIHVNGGQRR
jgi:hypothetical protein